jgi:anaerobic dimethyl sulfoxide reductase subunit A
MSGEEKTVITSCAHNCGARCILRVHVRQGRVVRISTDNSEEKDGHFQLRACLRGRAYRERLYHPDRLKYPLKRVGKRGEGRFARISWEEATSLIAAELKRITEKYGAESRYLHYSSGIAGALCEREFFFRLLTVYGGGYLNYYNSYSTACTRTATEYTFGTAATGSSRDNWLQAKLIILWGHNPAETSFGTNTMYYLKMAKDRGAKIIVVDPRYSDSAVALAERWIPLLPTTDNAMMDAMIYVMITEGLYDRGFVGRHCLGFDEGTMPAGVPPGNSLAAYILGESDGIAKTPQWAERITRVPAGTIRQLAVEYATIKPAALIQGWGPQRHACGEQPVRGAAVLAAITGNVGVPGGWASGCGSYSRVKLARVPYDNPVKAAIPVFTWPEAVERGVEMGPGDGLKHARKLNTNIRFIASLAGNCLLNQHSDINLTKKMLADESKCEFILVSDEFMTSSAAYADLVLPSTNFLERIDIAPAWDCREYVIFQEKAVEPRFECRTGYDWMLEVAGKLGVREEFSQGRNYEDWARYVVAETAKLEPDFPSFEEFRRAGIYKKDITEPLVAFREQVEEGRPFPTPSGKIEIFSPRLFRMNNPEIPAVPKYIQSWEGPGDPLKEKYPLQLIGWHSKRSAHSTGSDSERVSEVAPHRLWLNPLDAGVRGIKDGDRVRVFNGRGELEITARVTARIMPGAAAMPQGGQYRPGRGGRDLGGCINTLTKYHPTPLARGNPQHTNLVQVEVIK